MRIALITQDWRPNGGVAVYLRDLARTLSGTGHDVIVVHADPGAPALGCGVREMVVEGLAAWSGPDGRRAVDVLSALLPLAPGVVHVHACNNFALERELRRRYPALKTLHTYDFCPADTKFHFALDRPCRHRTSALCLPRMVYRRCVLSRRPATIWRLYGRAAAANRNNAEYPLLLVASEYVRQQAIATGYPAAQVYTLPYFTPAPADPPPPPKGSRTIVFCGRLGPEKGLAMLLRALARLQRPWRLVVAGDGYERSRAERLAVRLGLADRVEFRGWADRDALPALYRDALVVAMPSRWPEPFGLAGLEALAHARPVVAFAVGGIPEWLDDGESGFLVKPYDLDAFADRLARLLDDPVLATKMGAWGRARVLRDFGAGAHVERLVGLYREVVEGRRRPPAGAHV